MMSTPAWKVPSRLDALWFRARVWGHVLRRGLRNLATASPRRHPAALALVDAPMLAEYRSPLWRDGRNDEFLLVAGKVHNLRVARAAFDGIVVRAGEVLSFWRQLGRPSRRRGFVEGREVREGCVVPTVAGGLCQLSNALATCAVRAGVTLLERHGHTARIEVAGEVAADFVDATVFWNYVDLRLCAPFDFRVEVELSADELVVRLRGQPAAIASTALAATSSTAPTPSSAILQSGGAAALPVVRSCVTCNETACFRHRDRPRPARAGRTAVLVNAWTPEFAAYLASVADADWYLPWLRPARRAQGAWQPPAPARITVALLASLRRTLLLKRRAGEGGGRQAALLQGDRWLARAFAAQLRPEHSHVVVDQSLLMPLLEMDVLAGRSYDVLVQALPAGDLQRRLDAALQRWPAAASLADFRTDAAWCLREMQGLLGARRLVTPHVEAARVLFEAGAPAVTCLDWQRPAEATPRTPRAASPWPTVVFPASALPRKGALELAEALRTLGWKLVVLGTPASDPRLWQGVDVVHAPYRDRSWLQHADVVALPAHVEHSPRTLLLALAHSIPVVATAACGLPAQAGLTTIPAGEVPPLIAALRAAVGTVARD